ncbi:fasciclin domain-containing protein [Rhodohalobacter sp. SW132]|uniref:fasciclin domain-containing protein n=1 Tax=Rhodohalobacter sp. SW132 TaxID=2293433 RepID=UPI000E22D9E4|nr:fasciclin domain-containing protein [Rhodohalobacter sp. SW132]REL39055.1 fasciclin domain-containing protein [Rhodohalobacter sp. SW132]
MKTLKKASSVFSIFALMFAFAFTANIAQAQDGNVVDVINSSDDHTIFASLLEESNLDDAISDQGPFTIIAPNDEAFEAMGEELDQLRADPDMLQNMLIGHLFQGENTAEDVEPALGVEIIEGDIPASNGLVHVTNEVLN